MAKYAPSGNPIWAKRFGDANGSYGQSIAADLFGAPVVTGSFSGSLDFGQGPITSLSGANVFLAKLTP